MTDPALAEFLGQSAPSARRRWLMRGGLALGLLVIVAVVLALISGRPNPEYVTEPVRTGDLAVVITATGNLSPIKQVNVGSEESGIVVAVYVQNNQHVKKGQPLAQLDPSLVRAALRQSEAQVLAAQAAVAQNRATLRQTEVTLRRYEEVARLSGGKVPSQTELDAARADFARAGANLQAAEAQVAQANAALATNRTNLAKLTIYAPVAGVVLSRQVEPGQTVAAAFSVTTLFTIANDLGEMKLDVKVDEADVGQIAEGDHATFTVDAYPGQVFEGTVTRIDLGANATQMINSAGSPVTSTSTVVAYTASLDVPNPHGLLRPGMTGTARIEASVQHGQLLVPNAALRFNPNTDANRTDADSKKADAGFGALANDKSSTIGRGSRQSVYTLDARGKAVAVPVTVGNTNGAFTAVRGAAIHPGMRVITGHLEKAAS